MQNYKLMSDEALTKLIHRVYQEDANKLELSVAEMFDMAVLKAWFRNGFPKVMPGMSRGMIKLAMIPLIECGLLDRSSATN